MSTTGRTATIQTNDVGAGQWLDKLANAFATAAGAWVTNQVQGVELSAATGVDLDGKVSRTTYTGLRVWWFSAADTLVEIELDDGVHVESGRSVPGLLL